MRRLRAGVRVELRERARVNFWSHVAFEEEPHERQQGQGQGLTRMGCHGQGHGRES